MSETTPQLDDRTLQDLVDGAKRLIPVLCPEWTNHGPSDPGMALIEVFAWMTDHLVQRLNDEFAGIVETGRIEKVKTHRLEADDEHLTDLPRLGFQFDRKNMGRLREMVDLINQELGDSDDESA